MAPRAHVTSVEAIQDFRAALVIYLAKARPTLEEVTDEAVRTRIWLQNDQRVHWENQVRRRTRELEQAQQALFSAGISSLREAGEMEKLAVQRARHALEEATAKLKLVKQWAREFGNHVEPLTRQLDRLHTFLSTEMLHAVAHLAAVIQALDAYADVTPPDMPGSPAGPDAATTPEPAGPATETGAAPAPEGGAESATSGQAGGLKR